jgi:hypothetical protein
MLRPYHRPLPSASPAPTTVPIIPTIAPTTGIAITNAIPQNHNPVKMVRHQRHKCREPSYRDIYVALSSSNVVSQTPLSKCKIDEAGEGFQAWLQK